MTTTSVEDFCLTAVYPTAPPLSSLTLRDIITLTAPVDTVGDVVLLIDNSDDDDDDDDDDNDNMFAFPASPAAA